MGDLTPRFCALGKAVSGVSDRLADRGSVDGARRRFLQSSASKPDLRWRTGVRRGLLVFALVTIAALVWLVPRRPEPAVSFSIGWPAREGQVGEWIAAEHDIPVRFSEGTIFSLDPGAKIRVASTTAHGAFVLVEQGRLRAAVVHAGPDTQWSVRAGPFDVRVTGTMFSASWDPTGEVFELAMQEGRVVVMGPLLAPARELRAGEWLRVAVREHAMTLRSIGRGDGSSASQGVPWVDAATSPPPAACATAENSTPLSSARVALDVVCPDGLRAERSIERPTLEPKARERSAAGSSWRELAAMGKYRDALAAAENIGFADEVERASANDLLLLADTARFGGRADLAHNALLRLRERFGARGRSAYLLGKVAADQKGSPAEAVRWFETYLREEPNGSLAEQAEGRLLDLRKGDSVASRAAAQHYLDRYPNGSYAALARSLLAP